MPFDFETFPSPVRVLMRNGVPCEDVITERPRVDASYFSTDVTAPRPPKPRVLERVQQTVKAKVGRPRVREVKQRFHAGEGKGWNHNAVVKTEDIVALRAEGLTWRAIGERLGITATGAYKRVARTEAIK